ncbi:hypothetical protein [Rhizobium ruizarguesonis]|uniref:hypothetical protein n=1 Tax=Rhizobium ruizarguesonis TaxID=2081791 RepID=UPI0013EF1F24|nr:hypothetical protein [Rhizobium ruizarguesonis]
MRQLDLFAWADSKPSNVIDIMPALIKKVAREPWPPQLKAGDLIQLNRSVA